MHVDHVDVDVDVGCRCEDVDGLFTGAQPYYYESIILIHV